MRYGTSQTGTRQTVINGLAVIGFVALLFAGMALAVYTARYVPVAMSNLASAAVYLSSLFVPADNGATLEVVTTTIPFEETRSEEVPTEEIPAVTPSTTPVAPPKPALPIVPSGGTKTDTTYQIGTSPAPLSGLPDLAATITATGYLTTIATDSFVASTTVPRGMHPAVKFVIKNIGTNVASASWRFTASLPARDATIFISQPQPALNPGDSIEYTLGFDQASPGQNRTFSVTANINSAPFAESNNVNNTALTHFVIIS